MAESGKSLFTRGQISTKAASRYGVPGILKKTKLERANEEPFQGKQGRGDQGGADWNKPLDGGDKSIAGVRHIDTRQTMGSRSKASGVPSKAGRHTSGSGKKVLDGTRDGGGWAGRQKQPMKRAQIDAGDTQKPNFPSGAGYGRAAPPNSVKTSIPGGGKPAIGSASSRGPGTPRGMRGPTGPAQKAGAQSAYYGAKGSRP